MTDTKDAAQVLRDAGWLVVEPDGWEAIKARYPGPGENMVVTYEVGYWPEDARPETPDTIDWSHVDPKYRYMARDKNGEVWFFENEPDCLVSGGAWDEDEDNGGAVEVHGFASYRRGTVPWDKSLVCREDEE